MKKISLFIIFISFLTATHAQLKNNDNSLNQIAQIENRIKGYADEMINASHWYLRFSADGLFTRGFVQALRVNNSFNYPFDSITTVSKIYPPDSSFRIFTWQMMKDYTYYRQHGAIQIRTSDGSLKLYPLFDASSFTKAPNDSIRDNKNWIGAIYYKILTNMDGNKKVYTLLGYDENGPRSNKKWMEILTFDENGIPHFGGNYFKFERDDTAKIKTSIKRFSVEYKKESRMRILYDKETQMIVYDHLISENDEPENAYTYVSDGSYEAFKWNNNRWEHIAKLPTQSLGNGNAPLADAILDDNGNVNQKKLEEMTKKNKQLQDAEESPTGEKKISTNKKKKKVPASQDRVDY